MSNELTTDCKIIKSLINYKSLSLKKEWTYYWEDYDLSSEAYFDN